MLPNELKLLADAANYLENPSLLMQLANAVGKPLEAVLKAADKVVPGRLDDAVGAALRTALQTAVRTLPAGSNAPVTSPSAAVESVGSLPSFLHKMSVALTGSVGGLFGVAGLALELPITTTLMLRSIAAIAQEFGEPIDDAEVELQCLTVFSYGGPGKADDSLESSYLSSRVAIQEMVTHAARAVAGLSATEFAAMIQRGTAPAIVSLIAKVAARFNVVVTQKMVVQSLPLLGAATGATLNVAFMDHFNRVARYHFGIRSLERKYGLEVAQAAYRDAVARIRRGG